MHNLATRNNRTSRFNSLDNWFDEMFRLEPHDDFMTGFKLKDDKYELEIEVPGFGQDDLNVELKDNVMSITGEKGHRKVNYMTTMPKKADVGTAEAGIENGILTITMDTKEEAKPKQIPIK